MKSLVTLLFVTAAVSQAKERTKGSIAVTSKSKSDYANLAKISIQDAIARAVAHSNAKAIEATLDEEHGYLVFEVEVIGRNRTRREILVDAGTGEILGEENDD